jgi:hypothetical protein
MLWQIIIRRTKIHRTETETQIVTSDIQTDQRVDPVHFVGCRLEFRIDKIQLSIDKQIHGHVDFITEQAEIQ